MRLVHVFLVAGSCLGFPQAAQATFVDFTQITFGPSPVLNIQGVTISGTTFAGNPGPPVATMAGVGLGMAGIADAYSVDRVLVFGSGSGDLFAGDQLDQDIQLFVDGRIHSITIQPFLTVLGDAPPLNGLVERFSISGRAVIPGENSAVRYDVINSSTPTTINFGQDSEYAKYFMGIKSDFGQAMFFDSYLEANNFPNVTAHFGYSILSMEYTPRNVPEPTTLLLVGLGLLVFTVCRLTVT